MNMTKFNDLHAETKEDLNSFGVYTITNKITKKVYVGSTLDSFKNRWRFHFKNLKNNCHHSQKLQNAVNKYGIYNFTFQILEIVEIVEKELVRDLEHYWINLLDVVKNGYNISYSTNGGCLGYKLTKSHRNSISAANKNNKHRLNHKHEEETKKQIKKSVVAFYKQETEQVKQIKKQRKSNMIYLNQNKINLLKKKPVLQLNKETLQIIQEFDSALDAGKFLNKAPTAITKVCKGKSNYAYGFKWKYKE